MNFLKSKNRFSYKLGLIFFSYLFHQLFYINKIGTHWDELLMTFSTARAISRFKNLFINENIVLNYENFEYFGQFYYIQSYLYSTTQLLVKYFNNFLQHQSYVETMYFLRHLYLIFFSILFLILISLKLKKITNENFSIIFLVIFLITPSFLGHSLFNGKDIPLALSIFYAYLYIYEYVNENSKFKNYSQIIKLSIVTGIPILIRLNAIPILTLIFLTLIVQNKKLRFYKLEKFFLYLSLTILFIFLGNIQNSKNLINYFINSYKLQFNHFGSGTIFVNGFIYETSELPYTYIFQILFYKLPVVHLFFLFISLFLIRKLSKVVSAGLFFLLVFLLAWSLFRPASYDLMRHYLFLLPFISLPVAEVITMSKNYLKILVIVILYLFFTQYSLAEYKYIYLNEFVNEANISEYDNCIELNGCGNWATDYWGLSGKNIILNTQTILRHNNVYFCEPAQVFSTYFNDGVSWKLENNIPNFFENSNFNILNDKNIKNYDFESFYLYSLHKPQLNGGSCGSNISNNYECKLLYKENSKLRTTEVTLSYFYECKIK